MLVRTERFTRCLCGGMKHLRDPETGLFTACACLQEERRLKAYEAAGIPREFWHVATEHFPAAVWYESFRSVGVELKRALEDCSLPKRAVVLWGKNDGNKGLCGALLAKLFIQHGLTAQVVRSQRLLDRQFQREEEEEVIPDPRRPHGLIVHLGEETPNKMLGGVLVDLYRERRDRARYTAFTFTEGAETLSRRYGYRGDFARLLQDETSFTWIGVD